MFEDYLIFTFTLVFYNIFFTVLLVSSGQIELDITYSSHLTLTRVTLLNVIPFCFILALALDTNGNAAIFGTISAVVIAFFLDNYVHRKFES